MVKEGILSAKGSWTTDAWDRPFIVSYSEEQRFLFLGDKAPSYSELNNMGMYGYNGDAELLTGESLQLIEQSKISIK